MVAVIVAVRPFLARGDSATERKGVLTRPRLGQQHSSCLRATALQDPRGVESGGDDGEVPWMLRRL
jgi:hypothetical protein